MADKYIIRVTAGPNYDLDSHTVVPVNSPTPTKVSTDLIDVSLNVRIQNYHGLPRNSPVSSPYFSLEPHKSNNDQYSIALRFTPKEPPFPAVSSDSKENDTDAAPADDGPSPDKIGIPASDLQWGNDFDHPIRDRLPPGFGTAMNIVRWWIDPGLEGDAYADSPYLYGPALSSFNAVHVGSGEEADEKGGLWVEEGGDEAGKASRKTIGAPADVKGRMKWALQPAAKEAWIWEYGRTYSVDFFNAYLDFSEFSLHLPGFHMPLMKYWDGQGLRYVLRNRTTGDVYLVVLFTLYLKEDVNEDGSLKPSASQNVAPSELAKRAAAHHDNEHEPFDEEKALNEARRKLSGVDIDTKGVDETSPDDVD